jgi:hypothetical protein
MKLSDKAKSIIGSVAPLIFKAIGGPFGALAETILHATMGTGEDDKALESAITSGNPELLLKLKQADQDFEVKMRELDISEAQLSFADTANARDREIKAGDSWTPRVIAAVFITGYFYVQLYLLDHVIPQEMREIVMRTLGTLDLGLGLILGYYFGSSASSKRKDDTLSKLAQSD